MHFKWHTAVAAALCAAIVEAAEPPLVWTDEVVVTATRFRERYVDKPVNVTLITAEDIRNSAAKTIPDLLSQEAGVAVRDLFGNNAANTTVDLRGFGASGGQNTLILIDGRRASDIDLSSVQWAALPLSAVARIEIVRGAGSVLYGDGATAGVVNIITKSPLDTPVEANAAFRAGSYDTRELQLRASRSSEWAGLGVSGSNFESDGYRVNNRNRQSNAQADAHWLTAYGEIAVKVGNDSQGIRLPGARQLQPSAGVNQLATDRRGTSTPLDYAQREGNRLTVDWRRGTRFGEFDLGLSWRDKTQTSNFDQSGFPDYRVAQLDVFSFTPRARVIHGLFGGVSTLVAGADWYWWDYQLRRSNAPANIGQPINTVTAQQRIAALYLHNSTQVSDQLTLSAGARTEQLAIDATDVFDGSAPGAAFGSGAAPGSRRDSVYAHELGARYQLDRAQALTAKAGRSFRYANVDETYETSAAFANQFQFLRPQIARSYEAGYEARHAAGRLRATVFTIDVTDEIHLDPFTTGVGNTNLPPSRRRGFELDGRWLALPSLTLTAGYTRSDAKFREGVFPGAATTSTNVTVAGKAVPLVPRHKLDIGASSRLGPRTQLNAALTYVGEQFMDNDEGNTLGVKIPAYAVADVKLTHREGPWRLGIAINNVTDERYYNYAVRSQFVADRYNVYPLPERSVMLLAEYALP